MIPTKDGGLKMEKGAYVTRAYIVKNEWPCRLGLCAAMAF